MSNINVNNITPLAGTSGTVNVSGSLHVSGSITANGNIVLGDSTADSVSLGAEISSSIIPDATATYNLGSSAKKWNKVHAVTGSFLHISGATNFSSNVTITGSMTVSGSSTLTNFGNFRNRFPQDNRAFEVSTDPTVAGGFREGLATPNTGSAPHLHFMLTGSGYAGVGLLNPSHTLHVSTSDGGHSKVALYVDGKSYFGSTISSSFNPHADKTYNLGTSALQWENLHVSTASLAHLHAKTGQVINVSGSLLPTTTNVFSLGNFQKQWKSGSFGHISASTISASNNVGIAGDLSVEGSTILGNQLTNDTHLITGKQISLVGPVTSSGTFRNDGTTFDVNSSGMVSLTSTLNSANSIYLHANGGASETIKLHSDQSTSVRSIGLISDAGGIELDMNASSKKIAILSSGAVDIDAAEGIEIDSVGADMTLTVTADGAGQDLILRQNGSQNASVEIQSAGTGNDAIWIRSTNAAGSIDIDSANNITVDAADDISLTSTSADGLISLVSAHTAGQAIHLDGNAHAGSIVDIDAGILDIDVMAAATLDAVGVAIGAGSGELDLTTTGLMDINSAALDIDTSGAITIDAAGAASHIAIVTAHTAGDAVHIDANANAGSIVKIDAGILDLNVTAAATLDAVGIALGAGSGELDLTTTGLMDINSAALDIDTTGAITIDAAGAASDIKITTAHTAGDAFHLDANAHAGSIVNIDAGILDIDATGEADISGSAVNISGSTGIHIGSTSGGINIDSAAATTLDAVGIALGAGSGELDLTTTGLMDINSAALDIDTSGAVTIDAAGVASDIKITTAHTAGVAFHLDANANAASEVQIDAGILDIDVTGAATLNAASITITGAIVLAGAVTAGVGVQNGRNALTATTDGAAIEGGVVTSFVTCDDANKIIILPAPVIGNVINIIENGSTGYELRTSTPGSIAINGGTGSNVESAIAGAITYVKCVCVSTTKWICSQYDADGDESKVEAAA